VQKGADDAFELRGLRTRFAWLPRLGWLLPYATVAVVFVLDLQDRTTTFVSFLAFAPLLASRLLGRAHVLASGLAALLAGVLLGVLHGDPWGRQQLLRLGLIVLGTLLGLLTQGAWARERSALERAGSTISMASSLLAGVEPEEAYALLARSARTLYDADVAAVYRYDGDRMTLWRDDRNPTVPPMPGRLAPAAFPAAYGTRPAYARVRDRDTPEATMLDARGLSGLLWLPLPGERGPVGTLALAWRRTPRLTAQGLEASTRFAQLGARAIVGSERARTQAEVLQRLVDLLLTEPPAWSRGYAIRVRYESASTLARIGGDFYDVVEVGDDALAFIVADARGKGLEASSVAAVLKGAFRSLAGEGSGPERILARLDQLVTREGGVEDFVTALVGRVEADGRIVIASAGHPLPLGAAPGVPRVGAPLGLGDTAAEGHGRLRPGDRFVCFTDGLIEARDEAGRFLDQRVLEGMLGRRELDGVLDGLVGAVKRHVREELGDDLALLGLEYRPEDGDSPGRGTPGLRHADRNDVQENQNRMERGPDHNTPRQNVLERIPVERIPVERAPGAGPGKAAPPSG
jgi:hypothetical protein